MKFMFATFCCLFTVLASGAKIYVVSGSGYQRFTDELEEAVLSLGHDLTIAQFDENLSVSAQLQPALDLSQGYEWLCFFVDDDYSAGVNAIQTFLDQGGKVYMQYGANCCPESQYSVTTILSELTGNSVSPFPLELGGTMGESSWGYIAEDVGCCAELKGSLYKSLEGLPPRNRINATGNNWNVHRPIELSPNFGFHFRGEDFINGNGNGGIVGLGDFNIWYSGGEPHWHFLAEEPVDMNLVELMFPNEDSECFIFPSGLMLPADSVRGQFQADFFENDLELCIDGSLLIEVEANNSFFTWQDNSNLSFLEITEPGFYWVEVTEETCTRYDTITISMSETCYAGDYVETPNVFTPNGDGSNDTFKPIVFERVPSFTMEIFNRWGAKIFEASGGNLEWDGNTMDGTRAEMGQYFVIISYIDLGGVKRAETSLLTVKH